MFKKTLLIFGLVLMVGSASNVAFAQSPKPENPRQADGSEAEIKQSAEDAKSIDSACKPGDGALGGIPTWYKYLPGETKDGQCSINTEGLGGTAIILVMLGIFDILLFIAGFVAVVFVIWGGFKYLTSAGEPQKATAGRTTIFNALVGLVIAFIAARVVGFIAGRMLA